MVRLGGWRRTMGLAALGVAGAIAASAPATAAARVTCPLDAKRSASVAASVQWAFSQFGPPTGRHPGITKSYTHGRGTWDGGTARGWVCHQDMGGGEDTRHLVMRVTRTSSRLRGHVTRLGMLGVEIRLPLEVTRTDDDSCAVGTRATMTLFASYYSVHVTRGALRFAAGCRVHDHTWRNPQLKVLVQHPGGRQVD